MRAMKKLKPSDPVRRPPAKEEELELIILAGHVN